MSGIVPIGIKTSPIPRMVVEGLARDTKGLNMSVGLWFFDSEADGGVRLIRCVGQREDELFAPCPNPVCDGVPRED